MDKFKLNIPQKVFKYIAICSGVIIFFIVAVIIPLFHYKATLDSDIKKMQLQIGEQKNISSMYAVLTKKKVRKDIPVLPPFSKSTLSRREANKFQDVFRETADKSGLTTVSILPDLNELTGSSDFLSYSCVLKGDFANFRKMLSGLGSIPYIEKIEEVSIQQNPDSLEYKMKFLIALGK